jgi:hypothetical protein
MPIGCYRPTIKDSNLSIIGHFGLVAQAGGGG